MQFPTPFFEIIERDEDEKTVARGAKWFEFKADRAGKAILFLLGAPVFAYTFLHEIVTLGVRVQSYHVVALLIAFGAILISGWVIQREVRKRRSMIFHVDGTIETPDGLVGNDDVRVMLYGQTDIASIETYKVTGDDWAVLVFMRDGETYTLTRYQYEFDARKIAVTLTNALRTVREVAAQVSAANTIFDMDQKVKAAMADLGPRDRVHVVID